METVVNTGQAEAWNGYEGRHWAEHQARYDAVNSGFNDAVLAAVRPGDRILDIGCGNGQLTRFAARRSSDGHAVGVDLSAPMLDRARASAAEEGVANVEFLRADAQAYPFPAAGFDVALSRFGVMFFADPVVAFGNLRSAVQTDGRLACLAWRGGGENDFMIAAERAAAAILPQGPKRAANGPGQFGFADPDRVQAVLTEGGWRGVAVRPLDVACSLPEADLAVYAERMGPVGDLLPTLDSATRSEVERRVAAAFRSYIRSGTARFTAACWMVTARA
jgi:SAM-dependent methyltransferase